MVPEQVLKLYSRNNPDSIEILPSGNDDSTTFLVKEPGRNYILKRYFAETNNGGNRQQDLAATKILKDSVGFKHIREPLERLDSAKAQFDAYRHREFFWTAFDYIEADRGFDWRSDDWTVGQVYEAGKLLASIHIASEGSDKGAKASANHLKQLDLLLIETEIIGRLKLLFQELNRQQSSFSRENIRLEILIDALRLFIETSMRERESAQFIFSSNVLNHGDYHPGNVLYRGESALAAIDFDYAYWGPAAMDLGYGLFMFANRDKTFQYKSGDASNRPSCDSQLVKRFIEGYCSVVAFGGQEYDAGQLQSRLEPYQAMAAVLTFLWALEQAKSNADEKNFGVALYCCDFLADFLN